MVQRVMFWLPTLLSFFKTWSLSRRDLPMLLPKIGVWSVKSLSKYQLQKLKISRSFSKKPEGVKELSDWNI